MFQQINKTTFQFKAHTYRTQLENKSEAIQKINELVQNALKKKMRIDTKKNESMKEKRLESKKRSSEIKKNRQKLLLQKFLIQINILSE